MGNPIITQVAAGSKYSVADSARVYATLSLSPALGEADFDVSFPTAATPTIVLVQAATSIPITVPAPTEQTSNAVTDRPMHWKW